MCLDPTAAELLGGLVLMADIVTARDDAVLTLTAQASAYNHAN